MDRKCEVEGCDNLVECAHAPDLRASVCADHLMDIVYTANEIREKIQRRVRAVKEAHNDG